MIAKNQPFGSHRTGKVGIHQAAGKLFSKIVLYAVKDFLIQPEFGQQFHKNIFGKLLRFGRISQLHSQSVVPAADIQINAVIVQKRVEFFFRNTVVPGGNELAQKLGHALGVTVFPNRPGRQNRRKGVQRDIVPLQHRKTAGVFERASYRYGGRIFRIALANQTFCRSRRNRRLHDFLLIKIFKRRLVDLFESNFFELIQIKRNIGRTEVHYHTIDHADGGRGVFQKLIHGQSLLHFFPLEFSRSHAFIADMGKKFGKSLFELALFSRFASCRNCQYTAETHAVKLRITRQSQIFFADKLKWQSRTVAAA